MFVTSDTKLTGEFYDPYLDLYLDVAAEVQGYPLWWKDQPEKYEELKRRRAEEGIEVQDELDISPEDFADELLINDDIMAVYDDE